MQRTLQIYWHMNLAMFLELSWLQRKKLGSCRVTPVTKGKPYQIGREGGAPYVQDKEEQLVTCIFFQYPASSEILFGQHNIYFVFIHGVDLFRGVISIFGTFSESMAWIFFLTPWCATLWSTMEHSSVRGYFDRVSEKIREKRTCSHPRLLSPFQHAPVIALLNTCIYTCSLPNSVATV
jgi:hypothetical protein